MPSTKILLPGDEVGPEYLSSKSSPLRLGPGLRLLSQQSSAKDPSPSHVIAATQAGLLSTDRKRNAVSILSFPGHRYIPTANDLVVAQILRSSADYYYCILTPQAAHTLLPQLAFEGASKKTRPVLNNGDLVYARVSSVGVGAGAEIELTCVNPATGKAEPGGLGPLSGGMVYDISAGFAARLLEASSISNKRSGGKEEEDDDDVDGAPAKLVILKELGRRLEGRGGFEVAIGRNGRIWVNCSDAGDEAIRTTVAVGRCIQETDEHNLLPQDQKKLVSRVLHEVKLDV